MEDIDEIVQRIREISEKCEPEYQKTCFEILLKKAIETNDGQVDFHRELPRKERSGMPIVQKGPNQLDSYLGDSGIPRDVVSKLVDLETGEIYVRNFKTTKIAEIQRKIAALIGLFHLGNDNRAYITQSELVKSCDAQGVYDVKNFTTNMKKAKFQGNAIFSKDGEGWKITPTGMAYAIEVVKEISPSPQVGKAA